MSRLTMSEGEVDAKATIALSRAKLRARSAGDLNGAVLQAGYYAKRRGETMFVYQGNSFMHAVYRVASRPSEYLDPINNTGDTVLSVTPALVVSRHAITPR